MGKLMCEKNPIANYFFLITKQNLKVQSTLSKTDVVK